MAMSNNYAVSYGVYPNLKDSLQGTGIGRPNFVGGDSKSKKGSGYKNRHRIGVPQ